MLIESWANHSTSPTRSIFNVASNILANKLYSCKMQRTKPLLKLLENAEPAFIAYLTLLPVTQNKITSRKRYAS